MRGWTLSAFAPEYGRGARQDPPNESLYGIRGGSATGMLLVGGRPSALGGDRRRDTPQASRGERQSRGVLSARIFGDEFYAVVCPDNMAAAVAALDDQVVAT